MKLLNFTGIILFAASSLAQSINIASPTPGQVLTIGRPFTVEVDLPNTISPSESVSVVISLQECRNTGCPVSNNNEQLGNILYAGPYNPQPHEITKPPYQNFTFTLTTGQPDAETVVVHVAHFFLLGAVPTATLEVKNVTVNAVEPTSAKFKRSEI